MQFHICRTVCICLVSFVSRLQLLCVHIFIMDSLDASHALCLFSLSPKTLVESWLLPIPWLRAESSLSQTTWTPIMLLPSGNTHKKLNIELSSGIYECTRSDLQLLIITGRTHYSRIQKPHLKTL